jgi:hypothetical protein
MIGTMKNSIFVIYEMKHMDFLCNLISHWLIYFEQNTILFLSKIPFNS